MASSKKTPKEIDDDASEKAAAHVATELAKFRAAAAKFETPEHDARRAVPAPPGHLRNHPFKE